MLNHNLYHIHQHVTNEFFQGQGETMNVDTLAPLDLSLVEAKNHHFLG